MTRSVVTDPTTALDHAGRDVEHRAPLPARMVFIAGPIVVGAVVFDIDSYYDIFEEIDDSKKLSATKREALYPQIFSAARFAGVSLVGHEEIDERGLPAAHKQVMLSAYRRARSNLGAGRCAAIVDGASHEGYRPWMGGESSIFADRADQQSLSVAAASIIAKVWRDTFMEMMGRAYSGYGFEHNKGYPTPDHLRALREFGPCTIHRRSFRPVNEGIVECGNDE